MVIASVVEELCHLGAVLADGCRVPTATASYCPPLLL